MRDYLEQYTKDDLVAEEDCDCFWGSSCPTNRVHLEDLAEEEGDD